MNAGTQWTAEPPDGGALGNVVGGALLGGNWYVDYTGRDSTGDGIGDTDVPYVAGGEIKGGGGVGDALPLKIPNSP